MDASREVTGPLGFSRNPVTRPFASASRMPNCATSPSGTSVTATVSREWFRRWNEYSTL